MPVWIKLLILKPVIRIGPVWRLPGAIKRYALLACRVALWNASDANGIPGGREEAEAIDAWLWERPVNLFGMTITWPRD